MRRFALFLIHFYQHVFYFARGSCRFTPGCSQYTYEAVDRYGIIKGLLFGTKRIIRCHPWNPGGHDPVPEKS